MSEGLRERKVGFNEFPHVSLAVGPGLVSFAVGPGLGLGLIAVVDSRESDCRFFGRYHNLVVLSQDRREHFFKYLDALVDSAAVRLVL